MHAYNIAILGSGPGGYVAALYAAKQGKKVCLIEKTAIGGVCLNWGCIPTKTLLKSAKVYQYIMNSEVFGVDIKDKGCVHINWDSMQDRKERVVNQLTGGDATDSKKNTTGEKIHSQNDIGGYLTRERIVSWANLMNLDKEDSGLLITSSPSVWDFLKDLAPDAEILFNAESIHLRDKFNPEETQQLTAYIKTLLTYSRADTHPDKPEFPKFDGYDESSTGRRRKSARASGRNTA